MSSTKRAAAVAATFNKSQSGKRMICIENSVCYICSETVFNQCVAGKIKEVIFTAPALPEKPDPDNPNMKFAYVTDVIEVSIQDRIGVVDDISEVMVKLKTAGIDASVQQTMLQALSKFL